MKILAKVTIICFLSLFLILLSIMIGYRFTPKIYRFEENKFEISKNMNLNQKELIEDIDYLIDYISNPIKLDLKLNLFEFSIPARIHFEEVRDIFLISRKLFFIGIIPSFLMMIWIILKKKRNYLLGMLKISILFIVLLSSVFLIFENKAFEIFHRIFFNNDFWIFDPTIDPIIQVLPQSFFIHSLYAIIAIFFIFNVFIYLIEKILQRINDKSVLL